MKINEFLKIVGEKVILVPYKERHVLKYHNWMKCPELLEATASEPLSLLEEHEMQKSWLVDEDKCTFILLDKQIFEDTSDELESMIGDVNIFLTHPDDQSIAEIEVMIAEKKARGKGIGKEAILIMIQYGMDKLGIRKFQSKINLKNEISLGLFSKLGFKEESLSQLFQEMTLALKAEDFQEEFKVPMSLCPFQENK